MKHRFQTSVPPLVKTFSFHDLSPCPRNPLHDDANHTTCPFKDVCERASAPVPLRLTFGDALKVTLTESSGSFVVRSEGHYSSEERLRAVIRKHIYEYDHDILDVPSDELDEFPAHCVDHYHLTSEIVQLVVEDLKAGPFQSGAYDKNIPRIEHSLRRFAKAHPLWRAGDYASFIFELRKIWTPHFPSTRADLVDDCIAAAAFFVFSPARCRTFTRFHRFARYVGFIDLRLRSQHSPLALAVLAPPRRLRRDRLTSIATSHYGEVFGAASFPGTPYCMHDPEVGGAWCSQASLIIAMTMMSDRGVPVLGSFEITALARSPLQSVAKQINYPSRPDEASIAKDCLAARTRALPENMSARDLTFGISGLDFREALGVLNDLQWCRTSAIGFREPDSALSRHIFCRLVDAYVTARLPVILFLNTGVLYDLRDCSEEHCVVVVGTKRSNPTSEGVRHEPLSDLVIHDPGLAPYQLVPTSLCLDASAKYIPGDGPPYLHAIFAAPARIDRHAWQCLQDLLLDDEPIWSETLLRRYCEDARCDFRVTLVHAVDIADTFFNDADQLYKADPADFSSEKVRLRVAATQFSTTQSALHRELPRHLASDWYWCIEGLQEGTLRSLWVMSPRTAEHDPELNHYPWEFFFHVNDNGAHTSCGWTDVGPPSYSPRALSRYAVTKAACDSISNLIETNEEDPGNDNRPARHRCLATSVITSSTTIELPKFLKICSEQFSVSAVDLFLLREQDLTAMGSTLATPSGISLTESSPADVLALEENIAPVVSYLQLALEQLEGDELQVAAFATYLPGIVARRQKRGSRPRREIASLALANSLHVALELAYRLPARFKNVIIEMVAGTTVDICGCTECTNRGRRLAADWPVEAKTRLLLEGISHAVSIVRKRISESAEHQHLRELLESPIWAFALEAEPGPTYTLNSLESLKTVMAQRDKDFPELRRHIGLNVDVAHFQMCGITAPQLAGLRDYIIHSHVTGHPKNHTCDQPPGTWFPTDRIESPDYGYYAVLQDQLSTTPRTLPFSGTVALELEGCDRMSWVEDGLAALRRMLVNTSRHRNLVRQHHKI